MRTYERPLAQEIRFDLCDIILTSEMPQLGDITGGSTEWNNDLWS